MAASSHLLHHVCGSRTNWERPNDAVKAKGQASSMRKDTSSRRTGNTVTDISATCRERTKARRVTADEAVTSPTIIWQEEENEEERLPLTL